MDRNASPAVVAEFGKDKVRPFYLFEAHFDTSTIRNTNAYQDIDFGGNTYIANGDFVGFSGLSESLDLQVTTTTVSLSGVDPTLISLVLVEEFIDRPLIIRQGFFDDSYQVISSPFIIFEGRMDDPQIQEDPVNSTAVISVKATSHWVDFEKKTGRHTNHEEQQIYFAGDLGFEFVDGIDRKLRWGRY